MYISSTQHITNQVVGHKALLSALPIALHKKDGGEMGIKGYIVQNCSHAASGSCVLNIFETWKLLLCISQQHPSLKRVSSMFTCSILWMFPFYSFPQCPLYSFTKGPNDLQKIQHKKYTIWLRFYVLSWGAVLFVPLVLLVQTNNFEKNSSA